MARDSGLLLRWLVVAAVLVPQLALASPASDALVEQAMGHLRGGRGDEALAALKQAAAADPRDATPAFLEGAVLNRLGRYEEALRRLQDAVLLGSTHANLAFERGWALVGVGRWAEAVQQLEAYEAASPGRGLTSELLGRAYLGLGRHDDAVARLNEAMRRDPSLRPTVLYYLAEVELRRGRRAEAERYVEVLVREAPDSGIADALRRRLAQPPEAAAKPWHLGLSLVGGYNDNVIALNHHVPLPEDISTKRSGFARTIFTASYDLHPTGSDTLTFGYAFAADMYESIPSFDLRDHYFYVDYSRPLLPSLVAGLRLSDEFTQVAGRDFRNQATARPSLAYRATDWATVEVAYSATGADYLRPTSAVLDRDGWTHVASGTGYFAVPGTRLTGRLGYAHEWNESKGTDFQFQTDTVSLGLSHPLIWSIVADVALAHSFSRYEHKNSLAGPSGFEFGRDDDTDSVGAELSRPITSWLSAFVRYDYVNTVSNIRVFTYHQGAWSFGLNGSF